MHRFWPSLRNDTASAIASIAFDQPHAAVDGNVFRVLSRVFGINTPINDPKGVKEFKTLAEELLNADDPGTHNQALMEFGALVCTPKKPKCDTCIFNHTCFALQEKSIDQLPVKLKKLKIRKRYFNYLVFDIKGESTILRQRKGKGIWQNLYEFPLYETIHNLQDETELTEDLLLEGLAREFVNKVQNMRKSADLEVTQRIRVEFAADDEVGAAVLAYEDYIKAETLALECARVPDLGESGEEWDVNGHSVRIRIGKVKV